MTSPARAFLQHLPALTSVRCVLALGVVLFHYQLNILPPDATGIGILERARLAVDVFFILSGFVLAHVYADQVGTGRYDHRRFLIARLARIYPAHIAMLAFMAVVAGAGIVVGENLGAQGYTLGGFLTAGLLVHAWIPDSVGNEWNGPSWSLSAEWAAYLAFPIFMAVCWRMRTRPVWIIALAVALYAILNVAYGFINGELLTQAEIPYGVLRIIPAFLLGIGLHRLGLGLSPTPLVAKAAAIFSAVVLAVLMQLQANEFVIVGAGACLVLALALLSKAGADGWLAHPALIEAGEASYALYLVHLPLLIVWKNAFGLMNGVDSGYRMELWEAAVLLVLTIIAAFALHVLWERPARRWVRRRFLDAPPHSPLLPTDPPERFS